MVVAMKERFYPRPHRDRHPEDRRRLSGRRTCISPLASWNKYSSFARKSGLRMTVVARARDDNETLIFSLHLMEIEYASVDFDASVVPDGSACDAGHELVRGGGTAGAGEFAL